MGRRALLELVVQDGPVRVEGDDVPVRQFCVFVGRSAEIGEMNLVLARARAECICGRPVSECRARACATQAGELVSRLACPVVVDLGKEAPVDRIGPGTDAPDASLRQIGDAGFTHVVAVDLLDFKAGRPCAGGRTRRQVPEVGRCQLQQDGRCARA